MKILIIMLVALVAVSVIAVDESEGMRAMRLGCEKQKLGLGCTNYANFLINNDRGNEADAYFVKGCNLGNQDGCDKKRWQVKEVINLGPEAVVEPPILESSDETTSDNSPVADESTLSPIQETFPVE